MNDTNNPQLRSWVESANEPRCDFPIQNLPFGVFSRTREPAAARRVGVAIGDCVIDVPAAWDELRPTQREWGASLFAVPTLNALAAAGPSAWNEVRGTVSRWMSSSNCEFRDNADLRRRALLPMNDVVLHLPVSVGDYTDFYSSREHATNLGSMFRDPKNALLPNWKHVPVGYHGRSSSIVVSGADVKRPWGQTNPDDGPMPKYGPSKALDFELEVAFVTGPGNRLGEPIRIEQAPEHIFGMVLMNDWSARDIQKWEYVPLGPFLGKDFATTISPWVVMMEALDPYRVRTPRDADDPPVQSYLDGMWDWNFDLNLEVRLASAKMRASRTDPAVMCRTNLKGLYWNVCQQLAHQTVNGCNVRSGDLYGSGTVSGPTPDSRGSMIEIAWRGTRPVTLPSGEERAFLADGDTVTISGWCGGGESGLPRIGFGACAGTIVPARPH